MDETTKPSNRIPEPAAALGYLGALPFVVCATAIWLLDTEMRLQIINLVIALGTVLLAFMGGVRWGLAMRMGDGPTFAALGISIAPAMLGGVVFLLTIIWPDDLTVMTGQLGLLIAAFLILLASDFQATRTGEAPDWYPGLRVPLTALVVASMVAAVARLVL